MAGKLDIWHYLGKDELTALVCALTSRKSASNLLGVDVGDFQALYDADAVYLWANSSVPATEVSDQIANALSELEGAHNKRISYCISLYRYGGDIKMCAHELWSLVLNEAIYQSYTHL